MSLTAAAIRLMAAKGMSAEDIADIAEAMSGPAPVLSPGALRTRKWREKQAETSRGDVTVTHHGDVSPSCAQVVDPSLPSLRSEELKTPTEPNGSVAPRGAKRAAKGSRRVPNSWSPAELTIARLATEGHTPGDLERALTRMRDHEFKMPHHDWDACFRNWVRNDADRKPRNERSSSSPPDRRQAAYVERLGDIDAAMAAAVEQRRGGG